MRQTNEFILKWFLKVIENDAFYQYILPLVRELDAEKYGMLDPSFKPENLLFFKGVNNSGEETVTIEPFNQSFELIAVDEVCRIIEANKSLRTSNETRGFVGRRMTKCEYPEGYVKVSSDAFKMISLVRVYMSERRRINLTAEG